MPTLLTPDEAAERLKCSKKTLAEYVRAGVLSYVRVGMGERRPRRMYTEEDIAAAIARRMRMETPCPSTSPKGRRSTTSISNGEVVAIADRLEKRAAAMRKEWSETSERV